MTIVKKAFVRQIDPCDLESVVGIEKTSNLRSHPVVGEWSKRDFVAFLQLAHNKGQVVEINNQILAFILYGSHVNKIHIFNLGVHPKALNLGLDKQLVSNLKSKLSFGNREFLEIDLRDSNLEGHRFFHKQLGFKALTPIIRNWYQSPVEDAYKFRYKLEY